MKYENADNCLPSEAIIIHRVQESEDIFSLYVKLTDSKRHQYFAEAMPGQFVKVYCYGVGEVPISIADGKMEEYSCQLTIRAHGTVTRQLNSLKIGDSVGLRGPFGRGWPLYECYHKNIIIITGGIGSAPTIGAIKHITKN